MEANSKKPDYGQHLMRQGVKRAVSLHYQDLPFSHISMLGPSSYTTSVDLVEEGTEYCASFDYGQTVADSIFSCLPRLAAAALRAKMQQGGYPRTYDLPSEVAVSIEARLGQPQKVQNETFVPLEVVAAKPARLS